jgi:hypothetical protein
MFEILACLALAGIVGGLVASWYLSIRLLAQIFMAIRRRPPNC